MTVTTMNEQRSPMSRMSAGVRIGCWAGSLLCAFLWGGCARLAPVAPSASPDFQVTLDSLKTAVREAQRTAGDLRIELEEQRRGLAEVQVARAQLQGMLRETERRLTEARQIIDLQREELASARIERERLAQAARPLHSRLRPSSALAPHQRKIAQTDPEVIISAAVNMRGKTDRLPLSDEEESSPQLSPVSDDVDSVSEEPRLAKDSRPEAAVGSPDRTIVIQNGDTLWRLSRRHKVPVETLRSLNGLPDYRIVAGRTLRLPEPRRPE
ncbi:MAG: hypothetical protein K0S45_2675 [Nitrospira sp.]|jgi:hypothetical protein|nr:hypothetical protein [Nitrospira sp.]